MSKLPCRAVTVAKRRFGNPSHTDDRNRHKYTNNRESVLYRCPVPGRAGATCNQASVKRAFLPRYRAFRGSQNIRVAFNIESKRGWDTFSVSPGKNALALKTAAPREASQAEILLTPIHPMTSSSRSREEGGDRLAPERPGNSETARPETPQDSGEARWPEDSHTDS